MTTTLTVRCDGRRDYLRETIQSARDHIDPGFDNRIIVNDSGDPDYALWLENTFHDFRFIHHSERRGLGGCFKSALETTLDSGADYGFFMEDDTPLLVDLDVAAMARVLDTNTHLSQLMLMRPPFNDQELAAGGVYQVTPDEFTECTDGRNVWVEHDRWYGFQPNLVPRGVIETVLVRAENFLELGVTDALRPLGYRYGYWGGLNDPPMCAHVGYVRSEGYRW